MRPKLLTLSLAVILFVIIWIYPRGVSPACRVSVLNVGQGDAILIQTRDHQDILIDGGPDASVLDELGRVLPAGDRDIELMVLTHPHADHVNGLVPVTERYDVHRVLMTGVPWPQRAYEQWQQMLRERQIPIDLAQAGQHFVFGEASLDVLWPAHDLTHEKITSDNAAAGGGVNDTSIVMRLSCGRSRAMLTGDASADIEQRILDGGADVSAGLLKVGHHGSRFSSGAAFLSAVHATWAAISVGAGNSYKHPHPTSLLRLQQAGMHILRTDTDGTLKFRSTNEGVWKAGS